MYAVIRAGGKQYRVERDQLLDVDLMSGEVGSTVELKEVLLLANNGDVKVGTPTVDGAVVEAEIVEHGRDKKLRVFKYKNKTRYRRRIGHRTHFTRLAIKRILQDGKETAASSEEKPKAKRPGRRAAKPEAEAVAEATEVTETTEAAVEAVAEPVAEGTAEVEAKPARAPRRITTRKAEEAAPEAEASTEEKKPARRRAPAKADEPAETPRRRTRTAKSEEPASEEKTEEE
jgi:large subunit ribosomal protein L21